jgi:DNA-binding transcriptional LysR family regulator
MRQLEEPVLTRRFFVYTRAQRSLSPAAESFIEFLFRFVDEGNTQQGPAPMLPA